MYERAAFLVCVEKIFFLLFLSNGFSLKYRLILRCLVRHAYGYVGMNIKIQFKVYLLELFLAIRLRILAIFVFIRDLSLKSFQYTSTMIILQTKRKRN